MDKCFEILKKNELEYRKKQEEIYKSVYQEFSKVSKERYNIGDWDSYETAILTLKSHMHTSYEIYKFFDILKRHNYDMRWEIHDAISNLGFSKNINDSLKIISFWLNSPVIDHINFDGNGTFEIISDEYGTFLFKQASKYLNREEITDYIFDTRNNNICHSHAYNMSIWYPEFYTMTSKISSRFLGSFYHSYSYDSDSNTVLDLRKNCAIDKEAFDRLYNITCVSKTLNSQLYREFEITNSKVDLKEVRSQVLRVALYKEHLDSIGYTGPLEKAPSLKKSIY